MNLMDKISLFLNELFDFNNLIEENMIFSGTKFQIVEILSFLLAGIIFGIIYDLLGGFKGDREDGILKVGIIDLFYSFLFFTGFWLLLLVFNWGELRLYFFISTILGLSLYFTFIRPKMLKILNYCGKILKYTLWKLGKMSITCFYLLISPLILMVKIIFFIIFKINLVFSHFTKYCGKQSTRIPHFVDKRRKNSKNATRKSLGNA